MSEALKVDRLSMEKKQTHAVDLGMSHRQWRWRWRLGGRLLSWAVFWILPKSQAQAELADAVHGWSKRWRDPVTARESVERAVVEDQGPVTS